MAAQLSQFFPPTEAVKIIIVLLLSFLIGLEREEHKSEGDYSSVECGHFRSLESSDTQWL
jgi:hypothetical protein